MLKTKASGSNSVVESRLPKPLKTMRHTENKALPFGTDPEIRALSALSEHILNTVS
jgi:hypothetical protein